jgi:MOSC domain-containing protein YiiM
MDDAVNLRDLSQRFAAEGRIEAIILRPQRREKPVLVAQTRAEPGRGLIGDHRADSARTDEHAQKRELTLLQFEHLPVVARLCNLQAVDPILLRRNLVISGINLLAMHSLFPGLRLEWALGDEVRIEVTGTCDPCSRMEEALGAGGYNAMRGHGGMTARLLNGGLLRIGDRVHLAAAHNSGRDS